MDEIMTVKCGGRWSDVDVIQLVSDLLQGAGALQWRCGETALQERRRPPGKSGDVTGVTGAIA